MRIHIQADACILLALAVLLLPLRWIIAFVVAAAFHELCHYMALTLCGCRVSDLRIGMQGALMETEYLSAGRELICALAGPLGGFLLLLLAKWCPAVAICAFAQSVFNLLPVFPLDGGRAVRCLFRKFSGCREGKCIESALLAAVVLFALWGTFILRLGALPVLIALLLLLKNKNYLQRQARGGTILLTEKTRYRHERAAAKTAADSTKTGPLHRR